MTTLKSSLVLSLRDRVTRPARGILHTMGRLRHSATRLNRSERAIGGIATGLTRNLLALGAGYVGLSAGLRGTVGASIAFSESFADVRKVVSGSPRQLAQLKTTIVDMSKRIPVAVNGLADIMAAAGQAGIAVKELPDFTEFTSKAAVAFDMLPKEVGTRFAKLKNVFRLDMGGLKRIADAANTLSNNMASSADEVTDFTNRAAGAAKPLNLLPRQLEAVGSAMIAAGIRPETAARGVSAMVNRIIKGGPKIKGAFKEIGLSFRDWLKLQKKNGPEALVTLFESAKKSPHGLKALQAIVGQDFSDDFSKLLQNPALLRQAFGLVEDAAKVAGSVQAEFINKSNTPLQKMKLLMNNIKAIGLQIGDRVAPGLGNFAKRLADTLATLKDRVTVFDDLKASISGFMTGLGFKGGDFSQQFNDFYDSVFGRVKDFTKDVDAMGRSFERFRKMGANLRAFASSIASLDFGGAGTQLSSLAKGIGDLAGRGSIAGWIGLTLAGSGLLLLGKGLAKLMVFRAGKLILIADGLLAITNAADEFIKSGSFRKAMNQLSTFDKIAGGLTLTFFGYKLGKGLFRGARSLMKLFGGGAAGAGAKTAAKSASTASVAADGAGAAGVAAPLMKKLGRFGKVGSKVSGPLGFGLTTWDILKSVYKDWTPEGRKMAAKLREQLNRNWQQGINGPAADTMKPLNILGPAEKKLGVSGPRSEATPAARTKELAQAAGPQPVKVDGAVMTNPSGTQDVRVTNPQRPNLSFSFGNIIVQGAQDADAVARHIESRVRESLSGLQADTGYAVS